MGARLMPYAWDIALCQSLSARVALGVRVAEMRLHGRPLLDALLIDLNECSGFEDDDDDDDEYEDNDDIEFTWLGDDDG